MKIKGFWLAAFCVVVGIGEAWAVGDGMGKFDRPMLQLSDRGYSEGVSDEQAYRSWLVDRRGEFLALEGGAAGDSCRLTSIHLATANWILARETEPFVSAYLHDLKVTDHAEALRLLTSADEQLTLASTALDDCETDEETLTGLEDASETLVAFAEALRGLLDENADQETVRDAALSLSLHLESDIEGVPSAAKLLQACLFTKSERADLAMRVLPKVGGEISAGSEHHEYFGRLLRCRQILNRGGYAAVWSLLLLCEELAIDTFDDDGDQKEAIRAANAMKIDACRNWIESLEGKPRETTLAWCDATVSKLSRDVFAGDTSNRLLRLPFVLPMMVEPIQAEAEDEKQSAANDEKPDVDEQPQKESENEEPRHKIIQPK